MKTIVRACSLLFFCSCVALAQQVEVTNAGQHVLLRRKWLHRSGFDAH